MESGVAATCRISAKPAALRRMLVFGPMPGSHLLGRGRRKAASRPGGTSLKPAGLVSLEATALISLLVPMPSLTVIFKRWRMALPIVDAISAAGFLVPERS